MKPTPSSIQRVYLYLLDQLHGVVQVASRKMFGEYAVYVGGKVVGFVCDDQLYMKPTEPGRSFLGEVDEQPPYPGAKLYYLISGDKWEDDDWLAELFRVTADALPQPKPKVKKPSKK